jgi:hypothetical protein
MEALVSYRWTFGPVFTAKQTERMNYAGTLGEHAGCWVNEYDCGAADCPMRRHDGRLVLRYVEVRP